MSKFTEGLASGAGEAVIGLGSSVLGGLASSIFGDDDLENQERLMNHQFSNNAALMRLQAELNSPATIAKEYQKAGFNPYVAMGQGAGSSGGQASGSSVSIPEAAYSTVPSTIGLLTADTLQKLAGAYKSAKEGSVVRNVAESSIFKNYAEGLSAKARATLDNIEADFKKTYGDKLYQGDIAKKAAEVAELYQRANLAIAQQDYTEAQTAIAHLEQLIKNEIAKQEDYKSQMLAQRLNIYPQQLSLEIKQLKAEIEKKKSEIVANYGVAANQQQQAEYQKFMNEVYSKQSVRDALASQIKTAADMAVSQKHVSDEQANLIKWQAEQLKKATDNYEIQMWSNIINQSLGTVISGIGEVTRLGLVMKFMSPSSNPLQTPLSNSSGWTMNNQGILVPNPVGK